MRLREARLGELAALTELCLRSKAVWGYDDAFMAACRDELTIDADDLTTSHIQVAEAADGSLLGVVQVRVSDGDAELAKLFVDPEKIRTGAGRELFAWAAKEARRLGVDHMTIDADPDAAPFYQRMGARLTGAVPSGSIPGRMLPRLTLDL